MPAGDDPTRDHLIAAILNALPDFEEVRVADRPRFGAPERVGRHAPDYAGRKHERLVLALAKKGPELSDPKTAEQIEDIARHKDRDGYPPTFWLFVPGGWREQAEATVRRAASDAWHDRMGVRTGRQDGRHPRRPWSVRVVVEGGTGDALLPARDRGALAPPGAAGHRRKLHQGREGARSTRS